MLQTLGLEYHYQYGKKLVFPEIEVDRGQRLLISGFSGCGKTTLLSLIAGALKLQAGDIKFDGHEYSKMSSLFLDKFRADHIGYIFQTLNLIPFLSVSENIALGIKLCLEISMMTKEIKTVCEKFSFEAQLNTTREV